MQSCKLKTSFCSTKIFWKPPFRESLYPKFIGTFTASSRRFCRSASRIRSRVRQTEMHPNIQNCPNPSPIQPRHKTRWLSWSTESILSGVLSPEHETETLCSSKSALESTQILQNVHLKNGAPSCTADVTEISLQITDKGRERQQQPKRIDQPYTPSGPIPTSDFMPRLGVTDSPRKRQNSSSA